MWYERLLDYYRRRAQLGAALRHMVEWRGLCSLLQWHSMVLSLPTRRNVLMKGMVHHAATMLLWALQGWHRRSLASAGRRHLIAAACDWAHNRTLGQVSVSTLTMECALI